jgi:hypothetical protein
MKVLAQEEEDEKMGVSFHEPACAPQPIMYLEESQKEREIQTKIDS